MKLAKLNCPIISEALKDRKTAVRTSNIEVGFNPEIQKYEVFRIKEFYCPCCGRLQYRHKDVLKTLTIEEYKEKAREMWDFIPFW